MRVAVYGSLAYDRILNFRGLFADHIIPGKTHQLNVSFFAPVMKESYGGTAGNVAYSLSLLGMEPVILSRAGNDFAQYRAWLTTNGIGTNTIEVDEEVRTAFATILTDERDNQIAAFYPGATEKPYVLPQQEPADITLSIVGPGNPSDMKEFPEYFRGKHIPFIYDPAQQIPTLSGDDLKNGIRGSRALISNDYELALIMEKTGWSEKDILKETDMVVTTLGGEGSNIQTPDGSLTIPPGKPKEVKDPTGAGDAYRAGFMFGLLQEWPLPTVGRFAGIIACYTVETYGTQTHTFTVDEVQSRYRENFNEDLPT